MHGDACTKSNVVTRTALQPPRRFIGCCLQLYLHQLLETGGSSRQPPPGVVRVLKSKACRSAIMSGTQLSREQCVQLVQQLGQTELCFCCAHGR
jgi:DNA mismatch repair protein MLH3